MIRSLRRHAPDAQFWVLCLSPEAEDILREIAEPGVYTIALAEFEAGDSALVAAKGDGRSVVEYYFTLTPSLLRYVLDRAGAEIVTYLDGDMWFLTDPEPIYCEMNDASVLIIPHGFAPAMKHLERFGIYNVGWLSFRNDARGRACLEWWRDRTNEWCFDWVDEVNGRFCEQRYLDSFTGRFQGVHVLTQRGANLAPWNVAASEVSVLNGKVYADRDEVIFFHFHGLKRLAPRQFLTIHGSYKAPLDNVVRQFLYVPYLRELMAIERELDDRYGQIDRSSVRELFGSKDSLFDRAKYALKIFIAKWRGYAVTLPK